MRAIAAAAVLLAATAATAAGHTEIVSSTPEAGANLPTAPSEVVITFDDELDPDASRFIVADAHGVDVGSGEVDLTIADRNVMKGAVTITEPGVYTVTYTIAGIDGHEIEGTFSFGFQATGPIPDPTGGEPDTALSRRAPSRPALALLGTLLLVLASVTAARVVALR
jgi:methionine-rich copper-binding protein CopC